MKKIPFLTAIYFCIFFTKLHAQVGIGTATPHASTVLHVDAGTSLTQGVLITGTYDNAAEVPSLGSGSRLMFYPGKAAFRAGIATGTQWNNAFVGFFSVAMGYNTTANANGSTAMGNSTTASGIASTAMGFQTAANDYYSTAMGYSTTASVVASTAMGSSTAASGIASTAMGSSTIANGESSTAMGRSTTASGTNSTAMGASTNAKGNASTAMGIGSIASGNFSTAMGGVTTASGNYSTAMGSGTIASGLNSTAMGFQTTASGNYSTAMGYNVSTGTQKGAFIIGDSDPNGGVNTTTSTTTNQFTARFNNGYYFLTSGNTNPTGVSIGPGGNAWTSICDKNRKENFEPLNGEAILQKLSNINFTSWNYKKQDPKTYRHYGIMAQDFNTAFGKDKYGVIGNDTTVNPIDMIGIDMAAIQALVKRTNELKVENETINKKLAAQIDENQNLKNQFAAQNKENENLHQSVAQLQTSFNEQQKLIAKSLQQMQALALKQITKEPVVIK